MSTNLVSISTGTPPAAPPETNEPMSMLEKAKALRITNSIEYIVACDARLAIDDMIVDRKANHDPVVQSAYETHKKACKAREDDLNPLIEARRLYQQAIAGWQREQEELAELERRRQQKEIEAQAFCRIASRRFKMLYEGMDPALVANDPERMMAKATLANLIVGKNPPKSYAPTYR